MRALLGDAAVGSVLSAIDDDVLREDRDAFFRRFRRQLGHAAERLPVPAQQLAGRRPGRDLREPRVRFSTQHAEGVRLGSGIDLGPH